MIDRVRPGGDEGAALVLAIIYVLVVSVIVMSVVDYAGTSVRSGAAIAQNRDVDYALDAAVDGAVRQVRHGLSAQQGIAPGYGGVCDNYHAPTTNGLAVTVSCQGEQGVQGQYDSGGVSPAVNPDNVPPVALQTTANTGEPGISLDANGNYRVHGSVQATSSIRACTNSGGNSCSSGTATSGLLVEGTIKAQQCIGDIRTFGPPYPTKPGDPAAPEDPSLKHCPGGVADPVPAYMPSFTTPPPTRSVPACPSTGWLVTLEPGTYDNAAALNALTAGGCNGKILWFKPGEYLFKFAGGTSATEWKLADASVNVIGGTPFGWRPTAATRPTIPKADNDHPARHGCVTEYDALPSGADPANLGVTFVFTGESRLNIAPAGGNFELCAQPSSTGQQIALFGMPKRGNLKSGTLGATSVTDSGGSWNNLALGGRTIDGLVTTGSTPVGGSATVNWTGFDQLDASILPDDAVITRVVLKVAHEETSPHNSSVVASVRAADGTLLPSQTLPDCTGGPCTASIDLTRHLSTVDKLRTSTGQTPNLAFVLNANPGKVATESLDGAALDVYWLPKTAVATSATAAPATNVTNATNAVAVDAAAATINAPASNTTTTITLGGYALAAADLPAGAVITKAQARIAHKESAGHHSHLPDIKIGGTAADGSPITEQTVGTCQAGLVECTTTVDLTSSFSSVGKLRNGSGGGPSLTYAVKGKNAGPSTNELDGIRLEISYAPDQRGTAQGCVAEAPYSHNDDKTCAVLRAQGNNAFINLHGTIYATSSAVDLKIANGGTTVFGRGALVRTLRLFFNPSVVYDAANITIETPDYGSFTRHDRIVDFWACAPRPDGTREPVCDDGNAELHVVGVFNDTAPGTPVSFKLWSHRRQ